MKYPDLRNVRAGDYLWDLLKQEYAKVITIDSFHNCSIILSNNGRSCNFFGMENERLKFPRYYWKDFEINPPESALTPPKRKEKRWFFIHSIRIVRCADGIYLRNDCTISPFYADYHYCNCEMRKYHSAKGPFEIEVEI